MTRTRTKRWVMSRRMALNAKMGKYIWTDDHESDDHSNMWQL